jgi:RNA polymerase sigma-70 factor (ECF subfamily)
VYNTQVESALIDETSAIAAALNGDAASFGVLVERHEQAAFRAAWLILRDQQAAEDAAQEGFVKAYRELARFRQDMPFRPWLLRIVQNTALNEVRARKRRGGLLERVGAISSRSEPPPDDAVAAAGESSRVLQAIAELNADDQRILHLRYFLELPEREIAAAIDAPAGTVKSRLHRAGKRLRDVIERKYPDLRERDG